VDTVLDGMSTFAHDIAQMAVALRKGTGHSLIIIDEFGKGTMTEVGLSLLAASVNYWVEKGQQNCPHIFLSSHFHALAELLTPVEDVLSFHTMEVVKRGSELQFQYTLVNGTIDCSFAAYTAASAGIRPEVINRSNQVYELLKHGGNVARVPIGDEEDNRELCSRMDELTTRFLDWDIDADPMGFLELAREVLCENDEDDDDRNEADDHYDETHHTV